MDYLLDQFAVLARIDHQRLETWRFLQRSNDRGHFDGLGPGAHEHRDLPHYFSASRSA